MVWFVYRKPVSIDLLKESCSLSSLVLHLAPKSNSQKKACPPLFTLTTARQGDTVGTGEGMEENTLISTDTEQHKVQLPENPVTPVSHMRTYRAYSEETKRPHFLGGHHHRAQARKNWGRAEEEGPVGE